MALKTGLALCFRHYSRFSDNFPARHLPMQGLAAVSGRNSHLRSYALNSGDRLTQTLIDPLQILHTFATAGESVD
jgi:hypothetical protein